MAYRYEFLPAAARDLFKLTRHNQPLLIDIATIHIPAILKDPFSAGEGKKGDLAHVRAYDLRVRGVAYRLIYSVDGDVVTFVAVGPHDPAYERARRR
jgi:mRNA-degrading endonuclease RelE of RelBE toxin-antitoxin system